MSLVIGMCVSFLGASVDVDAATSGKSGGSTYAAGDDVAFGMIDGNIISWTILSYDTNTKTALVVSRRTLSSKTITDYRAAIDANYRSTGNAAGYVRWADNFWRGWLNKVFYNQCFSAEERANIQKTTLTKKDAQDCLINYYHDTSMDALYLSGVPKNSLNMYVYNTQVDTSDYIFFLSSDEYTTYKDTMKYETQDIWPLRSNTYDDPAQGLFANDTNKLIYRKYYYSGDGIRPAMYVKLGEVEESDSSSGKSTTNTTGQNTSTTAGNTSNTSNTTTNTSNTSSTTGTTSNANNTTNQNQTNTNQNNTAQTTSNTTTSNTAATNQTNTSQRTTNQTSNQTTNQAASQTKAKVGNSRSYANNGTDHGSILLPEDASYDLRNGGTAQVAIDLDYLNSTEKKFNVVYKSSNAAVFTVDSSGVITGTGVGTASLTVRMTKSNGKIYSMSCRINVK